MAKTADPVEDATAALDEAQRAADQARGTLESYKDKILAGADDINASDYANAAHDVEHAELKVQAAALALQAAQEGARIRRLHELKAEIIEQAGTPEEALADWNELVELCGRIVARCRARRTGIGRWTAQMRRDGVPRFAGDEAPDDAHAGLGWAEARMGMGDTINVDGRTLQDLEPGVILASAAVAGARAQGLKFLRLTENNAMTNDPERWFRSRY